MTGASLIQCRAGITTLDVMVAVMVLGVGVLSLAATVGVVGRNLRTSYADTQLATLAQAEMEGLLLGGHEGLRSGQRKHGSYLIRWQVSGADRLMEVRLVVEPFGGGVESAHTVMTLIRRRR